MYEKNAQEQEYKKTDKNGGGKLVHNIINPQQNYRERGGVQNYFVQFVHKIIFDRNFYVKPRFIAIRY